MDLTLLILVTFTTVSNCFLTADEAKVYYRSLSRVDFSLADGQPTDVIYTLFTNNLTTPGKVLTTENVHEQIKNKSIPAIFLIHGFTTDDTSPWYRPLRDEFFKLGGHNVVYINWSKAGNKTYQVSSANVKPIGKYIAQFILASGIQLDKIHIIGHSLGSQLASFIGKSTTELTGRKIGRITGLDPAGPCFSSAKMIDEERLNANDAEFVDIIHTDIQLFGYTSPIGHVDFYPNGGGHQPGCPSRQENDNCSHARSTLYFIESLSVQKVATEATFSENNFLVTIKPKKNPKRVIFGLHVDSNSRGVYYFDTNAEISFLVEK